jgi:hypothetical protein
MLVQRSILNFSIPGNRLGSVFFDRCGNLLVVYIPGHYIRLISCQIDDFPRLSLCFNDREYACVLPDQGDNIFQIVPFPLSNSTDSRTLLEIHSCKIYNYQISKEMIIKIYERSLTEWFSEGLHLAAIHFQDEVLIDEIISKAYSTEYNTREIIALFKEFLLAKSYLRFVNTQMLAYNKSNSIGNTLFKFFRILPRCNLKSITKKKKHCQSTISYIQYPFTIEQKSISWAFIPRFSLHVGILSPISPNVVPHISPVKVREERRRTISSTRANSISTNNKDLQFLQKLFSPLFIRNEEDSTINRQSISDVSSSSSSSGQIFYSMDKNRYDPYRNHVIEALVAHALIVYADDQIKPSQIGELAEEYRRVQENIADYLFTIIQQYHHTQKYSDEIYFRCLCNLHCAIEELLFPFPSKFKDSITRMGYSCLNTNMFPQFVEHDVFDISPKFVSNWLINEDLQKSNKQKVKRLLFTKLKEKDLTNLNSLPNMTIDEEYQYHLLESTLRKYNNTQPPQPRVMDDTLLDSDFLPMTIYLGSIIQEKNSFINETERDWIIKSVNDEYDQMTGKKYSVV